jgi:NEDD4-binding protein 2
MRGVPGSGKSTKAKKLAGTNGVIYSTDDFFMKNGEYVYDVKCIGEYHEKNIQRAVEAMQKSLPLIIIDNTNVKLWEMRKYVESADKYQYEIKIEEPETDWAWNYKKCGKMNTHGVPEDKIKIMIDNFEPFIGNLDEIRNAKDSRRRNGNKNH